MRVMGVRIDPVEPARFSDSIAGLLAGERSHSVSKINSEFLLRAATNPKFRDVLEESDLNIADGRGVVWAAKYESIPLTWPGPVRRLQAWWQVFYTGVALMVVPSWLEAELPGNIPGTTAFSAMLDAAEATDAGVYLFGSAAEVLDATVSTLLAERGGLRIVGTRAGYDYDTDVIVDAVNESGARLLVVALGSPRQEFWIAENLHRMPQVRVAVGEGGTFDFIVGDAPMCPTLMRRSGLEWMWRLFTSRSLTETGSRGKRVIDAVPRFISAMVSHKMDMQANRVSEGL